MPGSFIPAFHHRAGGQVGQSDWLSLFCLRAGAGARSAKGVFANIFLSMSIELISSTSGMIATVHADV